MKNVWYLQIEPTTRCNFDCIFCCGRKLEQIDMNFDSFKIIIDSFPDLKHIELQGEGEPFLNKEIFKMIDYIAKKNIKVSTITNGSLFTDDNVDRILKSGIETIKISIESPVDEDFKRLRHGNLEKVKQGIKLLIKERNSRNLKLPVVGFAVTIMKDTINRLHEIIDLYKELNMDGGIDPQMLMELQAYSKNYDEYLCKQQKLSMIENILFLKNMSHIVSIRPSGNVETFNAEFVRITLPLLSKQNICKWLAYGMFINAHGYATACCCVKDYIKFGFGKFGIQSVDEIIDRRNKCGEMFIKGSLPQYCTECVQTKSYKDEKMAFKILQIKDFFKNIFANIRAQKKQGVIHKQGQWN